MTPEARVRQDLDTLAGSDRGRELLQLVAARHLERGERQLTAGCWTDHGIAGCLFQHAYWQGVEEGVFADHGRPGDWIGSFVGSDDYGIVIRAIESFDRAGQDARTAIARERRLLPDRTRVRQDEWRAAVEQMLVETLGRGRGGPGGACDAGGERHQLTTVDGPVFLARRNAWVQVSITRGCSRLSRASRVTSRSATMCTSCTAARSASSGCCS